MSVYFKDVYAYGNKKLQDTLDIPNEQNSALLVYKNTYKLVTI